MNKIKIMTVACTLGLGLIYSAPVLADETEQKEWKIRLIEPYGNNPNLAHVWAYKAQEAVFGTAQKVGEATEKGIGKIKPGIDQAWENTKGLTKRGTNQVKDTSQNVASNVNEKLQETKEAIKPTRTTAPVIEQQSLSKDSSNHSSTQKPSTTQDSDTGTATSYAVTDL